MQQPNPPSTTILRIVGAVFAVGGLALMVLMAYLHLTAASTASWSSTEGRITGGVVRRHVLGENARVRVRFTRPSDESPSVQFAPSVTYRYSVAGQTLTSNRYRIGEGIPMFNTREEAQAYLRENYPGGRKVTVYYNPQDPSDAVLETGVTNLFLYIALGGALFVLAGGAMFAVARKSGSAQPFRNPA